MHLCLFEDEEVPHLYPLVRTRPVYALRLAIRSLGERVRDALGRPPLALHARAALRPLLEERGEPVLGDVPEEAGVLFVNGRYVAQDGPLLDRLRRAAADEEPARAYVQDTTVVAAWVPPGTRRPNPDDFVTPATFADLPTEQVEGARLVERLWHLLDDLRATLQDDFGARRRSNGPVAPGATVYDGVTMVEPSRIYVAPGAEVRPGALLSAIDGPLFIDQGAVIREGAILRGSVYVGPGTRINTGANLEGCAFGPRCKIAGEIHDVIFQGFANKAHPGFLGNGFVGAWCNLGAGTNASNMRNDYGSIKLYDVPSGTYEDTGRLFVGPFLGDHAKSGIDTMFNTGTVVDVCCNIYGADFPPRYLPPFSWGSPRGGFTEYRLDRARAVARTVMARRDHVMTDAMEALLTSIAGEARAERDPAG